MAFCSIPRVMAIATLATFYNNKKVFRHMTKIRKGEAVTLMMKATNTEAIKAIIYHYMEEVRILVLRDPKIYLFQSPKKKQNKKLQKVSPARGQRVARFVSHCLRRGGICRYDDCSEGEEQIGTCYHHTMICCRDEVMK
ncbi:hypothetical protein lerEdw1_015353 [Lerista edwardsae]|nr:hypothetical protein lerEdw1_015353 [Lerista edwardsae]